MDGLRDDDPDDDVTVVGDHELVVELRRLARGAGGGPALPPPSQAAPAAPSTRRPAPAAPRPSTTVWDHEYTWDDDDEGGRSWLGWIVLALAVVAAVVAAVLVLR